MWLLHEPLGSALQTPSQKIDIKAGFVHGVFLSGQQVHEQRTDAGALEALGDKIVSRAVAAAAAAVGEQYDAAGLRGNDQRSLQFDSIDGDMDDSIGFFPLSHFQKTPALRTLKLRKLNINFRPGGANTLKPPRSG